MALTEPNIGAPLAESELSDAEALVREAGWNQVAADWQIFRALGTVLAAREGSRVVATAATLPYGSFAWISMVLVAGAYRRHGLGTRLLQRCVDALVERGCVPVLDATPAGQPLYRSMGFRETWTYQRWATQQVKLPASELPASDIIVRAVRDADWDGLCAYDAAAFGANRSALLGRLRGRLPAAELIAERNGHIAGFMLGRNGRSASQIGPLVAEDDAAAHMLLEQALSKIAGPIYLDLADSKAGLRSWLEQCGFASQRPLTRMLLGRVEGYDDPVRTYAVVGPEFG
jgi:GNAT superfamily N-acetyltransferase